MTKIILKSTRKENKPKIILKINRRVLSNPSSDASSDSLGRTTLNTVSQITNPTRMVTRCALRKATMCKQLRKTTGPEYTWTKEQIMEWCSEKSITSVKPCRTTAKNNALLKKEQKGNQGAKIGKFRFCPAIWVWKLRGEGKAKKVKVVPARWVKIQPKDCILSDSKEKPRLFPTHKTFLEEGEELRTFMSGTGHF